MAACPYCEKNLKQPGWAPHIRRMHPDRPFLPFGSALAEENPKAQATRYSSDNGMPLIARRTSSSAAGRRISTECTRTGPCYLSGLLSPRESSGGGDHAGSSQSHRACRLSARPGLAETDGAHAADIGALIVKIQERIALLDASIANVKAMQEERERLAVALGGLRQVLSQLTGQRAPAAVASL